MRWGAGIDKRTDWERDFIRANFVRPIAEALGIPVDQLTFHFKTNFAMQPYWLVRFKAQEFMTFMFGQYAFRLNHLGVEVKGETPEGILRKWNAARKGKD